MGNCLARANVEGKLPQLRHLDISHVSAFEQYEISDLFTHSAQWNQLTTFGTSDPSVLNIEPGFLTSLQELILVSASLESVTVTRSWPHLQKFKLKRSQIYSHIVDGVARGLFPALKTFRYSDDNMSESDLFKLHKTKISVEKYY